MSLSVVALTFGLIFVAELPDKTMIATIVLASRRRPLPVWAGAATAMVFNSALAVGVGRLFELLPHRALETVVAALFTAGSLYLLISREESAARHAENNAERARGGRHIALASFIVIVAAEFGDITQVLTANLAAHYRQPWAVFTGASTALVVVAGIGAIGGRALLRVLPLGVIRRLAGALLAAFAVYAAVQAARA